jgi:hypothetical protein
MVLSFTRPWAWLSERPYLVLSAGVASAFFFLCLSMYSHKWHWFPRGGALLALAGFVISVRESLLYRPKRDRVMRFIESYAPLTGPLGTPIFPPNYGDPDLTSEQIEDWEKQYDDAMKDAVWENSELVDPGDEGRPMRDTSQMSASDLNLLRVSSILGIVGTFIWAFGDLVGGLPK